jgi:hypothetical protein
MDNRTRTRIKTQNFCFAAVFGLLIVLGVGGCAYIAQGSWQGYSSFEEFSGAVDFLNTFGKSFNEEDLSSLSALGLGAAAALGNGDIQLDFVNGQKLTSRYKVPKSLRQEYQYLANHRTRHFAYYTGLGWLVLYANTNR